MPTTKVNITFAGVYEEWSEVAFRSISKQTKDNYTAAYAKFSRLYGETFRELRPENYDAVNHALTGGKKTDAGRNRIIPVHQRVQGILDAKLAMGGEAIICDEKGKAYTPDSFRRRCYYPALDEIGVRRLTPHATRHTFATRLSAARTEDIQALAGHED